MTRIQNEILKWNRVYGICPDPIYTPGYRGSPATAYDWLGGRGRSVDAEIAALRARGRNREADQFTSAFRGVPARFRRAFFHRGTKEYGAPWKRAWFAGQLEGAGISNDSYGDGRLHAVYLAIKHPFLIPGWEFFSMSDREAESLFREGYDAVVGNNPANGEVVFVLDPDIIIDVPRSQVVATSPG